MNLDVNGLTYMQLTDFIRKYKPDDVGPNWSIARAAKRTFEYHGVPFYEGETVEKGIMRFLKHIQVGASTTGVTETPP